MTTVDHDSSMSERRRWGRFYTPADVVRLMVRLSASAIESANAAAATDATSPAPTIVDPACGDGALLLGAFDHLENLAAESRRGVVTPRERLQIVRKSLFGVDVDRAAVKRLRGELKRRIAPAPADEDEVERVVSRNIACGDALTGSAFDSAATTAEGQSAGAGNEPRRFDWATAFPDIARRGGFDVVICNPPYLREKDAKPMFDRIAETAFGKRWREPRMDLWYYFLHRGLDILRPGGQMTFIVNAYWTASTGARRMIERLRTETTLNDVVLLGDRPIFEGVSGRHLIFGLTRKHTEIECRIHDMSNRDTRLSDRCSVDVQRMAGDYTLARNDLFRDDSICFNRPEEPSKRLHGKTLLGDVYDVRQGIAENPPRLTRRHCEVLRGEFSPGQGVFVLSDDEVEQLRLTPAERRLLRPYYRPVELGSRITPVEPTASILYLTRQTAPDLNAYPNIARHLRQFRPLMERRRETRLGIVAWWQLHWPREERLFVEPRVLSIQMGKRPHFVWAERPTFVGFSLNVIAATGDSPFALPVLCGILNSESARGWFEQRAKKRGLNLEISGRLLRQFPLPPPNRLLEAQLHQLVERRAGTETASADSGAERGDSGLEAEIQQCVETLYGISRS